MPLSNGTISSDNANNNGVEELITAIDQNGELYPVGKMQAHLQDIPHLAISVFVFCRGKLLLQQRAKHKYHSGGLWANTCCSHPRWQESPDACAKRRIYEELGFTTKVDFFGKIEYAADVGGNLVENELAYCYVGEIHDDTCVSNFNKDEVNSVCWVELDKLKKDIASYPDSYTQWLKIYILKHFELLHNATERHRITAEPLIS